MFWKLLKIGLIIRDTPTLGHYGQPHRHPDEADQHGQEYWYLVSTWSHNDVFSSRVEWVAERLQEHPDHGRQADLDHDQGQVDQRAWLLQPDRGRQEEELRDERHREQEDQNTVNMKHISNWNKSINFILGHDKVSVFDMVKSYCTLRMNISCTQHIKFTLSKCY